MTGLIRIPNGTDLGTVINDMLELTGTRPAELARLTGFAEGQISKWRRGMVVPSAPVLMAIFDALGFDFAGAARIKSGPETAPASTLADEHPSAGVLGCTGGAEGKSGASEGYGDWNWTPTADGGSYSGPHGPDICPAMGCQHEGGAA